MPLIKTQSTVPSEPLLCFSVFSAQKNIYSARIHGCLNFCPTDLDTTPCAPTHLNLSKTHRTGCLLPVFMHDPLKAIPKAASVLVSNP